MNELSHLGRHLMNDKHVRNAAGALATGVGVGMRRAS